MAILAQISRRGFSSRETTLRRFNSQGFSLPGVSLRGFTLIEMVIVILILGIIIAMSSSLITQGLYTFSQGENITNANWQGQIATSRMSRDMLLVRSSADMTTIAANNFAFTDVNSNTMAYSLSGTSLMLTKNGNSAVLADGIQSIAFTYFDKNGAVTATASLVRLIQFSINVTQNGVNYRLATMVNPRNLL